MPIRDKSPFAAWWNKVSGEGEPVQETLHPEDILAYMAEGMTPEEISVHLGAPIGAVEHVICLVPEMMTWRRQEAQRVGMSTGPGGERKLPSLPGVPLPLPPGQGGR